MIDSEHIKILYELLSNLTGMSSPDTVCHVAVDKMTELFRCDGAELYCLDTNSDLMHLKAHSGIPDKYLPKHPLHSGQSLSGAAAVSDSVLFLTRLTEDERINPEFVYQEKLFAYCGIPLRYEGDTIGVLGLYFKQNRSFNDDDLVLFEQAGRHIGRAIHDTSDHFLAVSRAKRFTTINQIMAATRDLGTKKEVLQNVARSLVQSLGFDAAWIGLINKNENTLEGETGFGQGIKKSVYKEVIYTLNDQSKIPPVRSAMRHEMVVCQSREDAVKRFDPSFIKWIDAIKAHAFIYVPIHSGDSLWGMIGVFCLSEYAFDETDIRTLSSVAEQTGIALENVLLYEEVKNSEERYRTLFEAAGTSLIILDETGNVILVNHAFENLSGCNRKSLVGMRSLNHFFKQDFNNSTTGRPSGGGPPQSWETEFTDIHNHIRHVHVTIRPIPGSDNQLMSISDMTQQRELERKLYRSEELAALGELSAGIAHEIRNPLAAITNSVSLLMDEPSLTSEGSQLIDVVKEESDHLAAIVDDFLKFARPKVPKFTKVDINQLTRDVIRKCRDIKPSSIHWKEELDLQNPEIYIDRHQIQQVLTNLILNSTDAVKENGCVRVVTEIFSQDNQPWIKLRISDTGEGIPEDQISKIFQPFYSTKEKGTGMGLSICRRIVDNHQGDILVESRVGQGTTFTVMLPVRQKT